MKTIYVVQGTTGEYSGRSEWSVCAYTDLEMARAHVTLADDWARADHVRRQPSKRDKYGMYFDHGDGPPNPYDPSYRADYTGTYYYLAEVDVRDALPEVPKESV